MAEDAAANHEPAIFDITELDGLLLGFDDDNSFFNFDIDFSPDPSLPESGVLPHVIHAPLSASPPPPNPPMLGRGSPNSVPTSVFSGERFQLEEADGGHTDEADDFFSEVLVEGSDIERIVSEFPKAYDCEGKEEKDMRMPVVTREEENDPLSKKLIRKMRNRESAIKSRERKKMYTKDLEMKSKYLESECRRLDNLLRCYMVENSVLRQTLQFQKERTCGASMAKQESAVLFVESLPLVSLFWIISIACPFLVLNLQYPNLKIILSREVRRDLSPTMAEVKRSPKIVDVISSPGVEKLRRRYRGLRARMKQFFLFPLHAFGRP
ncbi:bZIP transcription factor 60 [Platanthera guangdongensis]|uniref:BZIP transcription factor 60 n=1 Tax=Platanthera guangdongensis TaxID=2320717 RepID=A0ABR2MGV6_9ASPA